MTSSKTTSDDTSEEIGSKIDALKDCMSLVQQAQIKLDSLGHSMASIHLSQALEAIRTLHARMSAGFD